MGRSFLNQVRALAGPNEPELWTAMNTPCPAIQRAICLMPCCSSPACSSRAFVAAVTHTPTHTLLLLLCSHPHTHPHTLYYFCFAHTPTHTLLLLCRRGSRPPLGSPPSIPEGHAAQATLHP